MYPSFIFIRHGEGESNQKSNSLKKGDGLMSKLEVER